MLHLEQELKPANEAIGPMVSQVRREKDPIYRVTRRSSWALAAYLDFRPDGNITIGQFLHVTRLEIERVGQRDAQRAIGHIGRALGHLVSDEAETRGLRMETSFDLDMTPIVALAIAENYLAIDREALGHELAMREVISAIGALQNQMLKSARRTGPGETVANAQ